MLLVAAGLLDIDVGMAVWTLIVFSLLLFVLSRFAWRPILAALVEREQRIQGSLERAEQMLAEAKRLQAENERRRHQIELESQKIIHEAREAAERLRAELLDRARQEARALLDRAHEEIERNKERALVELRVEAAELAVLIAEKILRTQLDARRQRELIESVLAELEAS
ncbi:MAG: F0F1 ATP synthase subunit B [Bacteroidetes bacterium]|nr:F0F1 ATP synthase subunit B [Rhodothermia bacterium]MCS7154406.1 F0F1 ATP synthase subunit B [Bacteroidota bacterium]MCX7907651.1 F0F1 ATP synthase subunit B [Bacteroidota bacterium]MDW8137780.1 F0F1 ATP synthase subunit B [Bacteroidota bacterium]MDW8286369.1 F0F1 ATP synthase subunit B [Bacteroidota bacterium]